MTHKELEAWVMVLSAVVISGWVWWDATRNGVPADVSGAAWKMVWAIGYSILFNIIAMIVGHILFGIFTGGRELADEKADERDRLINGRAMRNGYFVLSIGVLGVLVWQGLGLSAELGPYALFGISMLAGGIYALSQLVYYRIS
ncbi:MAG: hypothetical protein JNL14_09275 [Devosia sp.]|uniref:hypothetical protein n=1 Tax=Devosia sp. TaxID=1871048 RepID=UPI001A437AC7|nr:hypothetical protein [Devosia sp.]MBL8597913.1 hypothetical protein [Devosia sp.]